MGMLVLLGHLLPFRYTVRRVVYGDLVPSLLRYQYSVTEYDIEQGMLTHTLVQSLLRDILCPDTCLASPLFHLGAEP